MRWSPYVEFRCGHDQESWDKLTPEEQKAAYRATGKQRKAPKPEIVEDAPDAEFLIYSTIPFGIRLVSVEELRRMPVFEMY